MTIGGRNRTAPAPIEAIAYHSDAGVTNVVWAKALITAYAAANMRARPVFQTDYAWDHRDPTRGRDWPPTFEQTGYVRIGEAYREIPLEATHIQCHARFALIETGAETTVYHRLVIDGTAGTAVEQDIAPTVAQVWDQRRQNEFLSPFGHHPNTYGVTFGAEIGGGVPGTVVEVYAEAYAVQSNTAQAVGYWPRFCDAYWEVQT